MHSILLVDDEWTVREGLKSTVPWERVNCRVIGTAPDGMTALMMLEQLKPDILLTDVRMPGLDGIELARRAMEKFESLKVILLSGFDEFEYAKAAIDIGVIGYVLKPTDVDELLAAVKKGVNQIDASRQRTTSMHQLQTKLSKSMPLAVEKLLVDMMFDPGDVDSAVWAELFDESPDDVFAAFQVVMLEWQEKGKDGKRESVVNARRTGAPAGLRRLLMADAEGEESRWWIPFWKGEAALITRVPLSDEEVGVIDGKLARLVESGSPVAVGVSGVHTGIQALPTAASEATIARGQNAVVGWGKLVNFAELGRLGALEKEELVRITAYVKEHFHEDISLRELSRRYQVSESHLSRIFRQFNGLNFSDYLTRLRMQKAKRLLRVPGARVHEVSQAVGYQDPRYFSQVFRRQIGLRPTEFRAQSAAPHRDGGDEGTWEDV